MGPVASYNVMEQRKGSSWLAEKLLAVKGNPCNPIWLLQCALFSLQKVAVYGQFDFISHVLLQKKRNTVDNRAYSFAEH